MNKTAFDELDEQLQQLAMSAQQHPPLAQGRQLALRKLLNGILQSGRLCRPQRGQFSGVYEDIYDEARQELLLYICQNIDKYDPQRGSVMAWVNVLFERRFFKEAIPKILGSPGVQKMTLADLDNFAVPESPPVLKEILTEYIESDPENLFHKEHIENHPEANFRAIARRRILGDSWKQISVDLDIKIPTISSFYYRSLNKFSANFKKYYLNNIA
ncbi:sigma-70 family RNA polymerase sigma factor [Cyanobacteria bacterium FACHB-472]|nr:sigma-70 family RNA polymerase sigma factor [Cyanobacteria bacterium FACHB-472]